MTCTLVGGIREGDALRKGSGRCSDGDVAATKVLDWHHPRLQRLDSVIDRAWALRGGGFHDAKYLAAAHAVVQRNVRAVYGLDDTQPVSTTLRRGRGSCSQRLAVLEALARSRGIATRVEGLILRGEFWYPRFPRLRALIPERVLLAWPEFLVDGSWCTLSQVLAEPTDVVALAPFTNSGTETLFDAAARAPISWTRAGACDCLDLSEFVDRSLGTFDSRDVLFEVFGQTMCWSTRTVVDPVFRNWSASG